jgi:hypothetical protein
VHLLECFIVRWMEKQGWSTGPGRLSPPLKKGDLGGFQALIKIPPYPPLRKGGGKA